MTKLGNTVQYLLYLYHRKALRNQLAQHTFLLVIYPSLLVAGVRPRLVFLLSRWRPMSVTAEQI